MLCRRSRGLVEGGQLHQLRPRVLAGLAGASCRRCSQGLGQAGWAARQQLSCSCRAVVRGSVSSDLRSVWAVLAGSCSPGARWGFPKLGVPDWGPYKTRDSNPKPQTLNPKP